MLYSIGKFQLFPERRVLLHSDAAVRLGARAFDLLVALAERSGEIVSNTDLVNYAWPHAVVEEVALRVHLSALRKALQAGGLGASPIANIPGRGYMLSVPVVRITNTETTLRTLAGSRDNRLPSSGKRLIGREAVASQLSNKLRETRFLSIIGPGGIGKTSVALLLAETLAEDYLDGIVFADLAALTDPELLWSAISNAAHLAIDGENPLQALVAAFQGRRVLLILDNCEHVVEAAAAVAGVLWREAPTLDLLVTSREPLRAAGEWVHRLPALEFPPDERTALGSDARSFSAVQMLIERVTASGDSFVLRDDDIPVAAELCRKLDGIPLAIELVASSIATFGLRNVAASLEDWFGTAPRGPRTATARHQTISATLGWSFDLLPDREKAVLLRLAVFQGGVELQMAVSIITDRQLTPASAMEAIYNLYEKSMISADLSCDEIQYRLLETTRAYALGKLHESGRYQDAARRHAEFFGDFFAGAEAAWNELPQTQWVDRFGLHLVDLRSALSWALSEVGDIRLGATLLADTGPVWFELGLLAEYRDRLAAVLGRASEEPKLDRGLELRLKIAWAQSTWITHGATPQMLQVSEESLRLALDLQAHVQQMQALWLLWDDRNVSGGESVTVTAQIRRLVETSPDPVIQLSGLQAMSITVHYEGDQFKAWELRERMDQYPDSTFREMRRIGHRADQKLAHTTLEARILWLTGFPDRALNVARRGVTYAERLNSPANFAYYLAFAACPIAMWCGDRETASEWADVLKDISARHSFTFYHALWRIFDLAIPWLETPAGLAPGYRLPPEADHQFQINQLELFSTLHPDFAAPSILQKCDGQDIGWCLPEVLRVRSLFPRGPASSQDTPERLLTRSKQLAQCQGALSWELRSATSLARLLQSQGRVEEARQGLQSTYGKASTQWI
jgi:predicted ATPase/DNA-binding winged helix-turn-helix (wHTH) protein